MSIPIIGHIGLLVGFGLILAASAKMVVRETGKLAHMLGATSFTLAFLLLGILTSLPEIFVSIQAAVENVPQFAMGNLLGGSILLLSLVIGLTSVLLGKIVLDHGLPFSEIIIIALVIAAPIPVLWDGALTRPEGVFLVGLYIIHAFLVNNEHHVKQYVHTHRPNAKTVEIELLHLVAGVVGIILSCAVIVSSGKTLSQEFGISPLVFGLVLLSFGTNLPEFALAIEAVREKRKSVAFGDFLGSAAANTLILGALGIVMPFGAEAGQHVRFALVLLLCMIVYFVWALSSGKTITRKEGMGLLFFYAAFLAYELFAV